MSSVQSYLQSIQNKWNNDRKTFTLYSAVIGAVGVISLISFGKYVAKKKTERALQTFEKTSNDENKVILHTFKPCDIATPNASPACVKMVAFFNYHKIDFIEDYSMSFHPETHKAPWITYKNDHIVDSNMIIEYFTNHHSLKIVDIDSHLNKLQKSILIAYKAMIEDCLYFIIVYRRWLQDENFSIYMDLFNHPKWLQKLIIKPMILPQVKQQIWAQGTSRLPPNVIYKKGIEIIESIITYIGDKKFFFGEKMTSLDISIYGHLGGMYQIPMKWKYGSLPYKKEINEYMKRIEMECYGQVKYWKDII